jgi:hypothetical protein
MKKIILASSILLLAAACNKSQPASNKPSANTQPQVNLTQTYTNTNANYTYKFPDGYVVDTGTDSGMMVPVTPTAVSTGVIRPSDNQEVFQINPTDMTSFTLQSVTDYVKKELPTVSNNISVSPAQVGNMNGYKAVDDVASDSIPSDRYYFQNSQGTVFELLMVKAENVSLPILNSFSFTK